MELETKIKIIENAKKRIQDGETDFLCCAISSAHNSIVKVNKKTWLYFSGVFRLFPEFLKYKPESTYIGSVWFDTEKEGIKKRITICNKIIKELKSKLNNQ